MKTETRFGSWNTISKKTETEKGTDYEGRRRWFLESDLRRRSSHKVTLTDLNGMNFMHQQSRRESEDVGSPKKRGITNEEYYLKDVGVGMRWIRSKWSLRYIVWYDLRWPFRCDSNPLSSVPNMRVNIINTFELVRSGRDLQ